MKRFCLTLLVVQFAIYASGAIPASEDITEITLERTACFGSCPVYKVTLRNDGTIVYEGKEFVKEVGKRSGKISKEEFQQLVAKIQGIGFFTFKEEYRTKENPNGSVTAVTDLPTCITTVTRGKESKTVRNYFGGPETLKELEDLIDKVSNSARWVKEKG